MGNKWKTSFLTDHYIISSGLSKPAKDFGTGYPFLSFKDIFYNYFLPDSLTQLVQSTDKERAACSVKRGDVFLTRTSETMHELGMSSVALKDYADATFNGFCKRLRPKEESELEPEYVGYYLRSPLFRQNMLAFSTMSTRASLNNEMISQLEISYPDRKIQKKIAHVLLSLDKKIAISKAINQTLEQMSQTLFKSWFVDFDPVIDNALDAGNPIPETLQSRAELRQKVHNSADFKPLPADIRALFPAEFEETELGWVPKGWLVTELGELVTVKRGGSPRPIHDFLRAEGFPWVKISDATASSTRFLMSTKEFIKREGLNKTVLLKKGSLILSNSATPGLPKFLDIEACIHDGWLYFPEKEKLTDIYLYNLFLEIKEQLISQGNGSVFTNLKTDILKQFKITVPSEGIISYFDKLGTELHKKILDVTTNTENLTNLRDTLLPKLISGELSLEDLPNLVAQTEPA
ncbi:TPA: restriction endonuclease subunit S [Citrobacter freundii]|nr:restriction endonuclease subunit S [Citrobacter freundii]